ncbi:homeodomain superfamily [Paecilomyces lecythidis]
MAVSYASGLPAGRSQTLPSFRELLPPHLHEEIDSAPFYASRQPQPDRSPSSIPEPTKPRSVPGSALASPAKVATSDPLAEFASQPTRFEESQFGAHRDHGLRQPQPSGNTSPMASVTGQPVQFTSRGPSPILPPIHNLHSLPERNLSRPGTSFDDTALRPSSFPRDYAHEGPVFSARNRNDMDLERQSPPSYTGSSVPALAYNQPPYDTPPYVHYPQAYRGEPEYSSSIVPNQQHSNFGILGDPIDPRNKRRRGNLPKPVTDILRAWFHEHLDHPYPSEEDKQIFMTRTGLSISQVRFLLFPLCHFER